jgi:hypothetical protein
MNKPQLKRILEKDSTLLIIFVSELIGIILLYFLNLIGNSTCMLLALYSTILGSISALYEYLTLKYYGVYIPHILLYNIIGSSLVVFSLFYAYFLVSIYGYLISIVVLLVLSSILYLNWIRKKFD